MKIYDSVEQLIGSTPLLRLNRLAEGMPGEVVVKVESRNPGASIKDRVALNMINEAERSGKLKKGGLIVEPTSGNTGIGLAVIAAIRGYRLIITMPDTMSRERQVLMKQFGAELILTPGAQGMAGAIAKAQEIVRSQGAFMADQFGNPANPEAHFNTTGPEIWNDTDGKIDAFVAGIGTGGTFSGTVRYLKSKNPHLYAAAVEPDSSAVISGSPKGAHGIQGIGAGFIPGNFDRSVADEIIRVKDADAIAMARKAAPAEGILCGISSGANIAGALELASRPEFAGKRIATVICDTGERYLSTVLFS